MAHVTWSRYPSCLDELKRTQVPVCINATSAVCIGSEKIFFYVRPTWIGWLDLLAKMKKVPNKLDVKSLYVSVVNVFSKFVVHQPLNQRGICKKQQGKSEVFDSCDRPSNQWPLFSISAESITGCMFGANFEILVKICGVYCADKIKLTDTRTDGGTTIPLRPERPRGKNI